MFEYEPWPQDAADWYHNTHQERPTKNPLADFELRKIVRSNGTGFDILHQNSTGLGWLVVDGEIRSRAKWPNKQGGDQLAMELLSHLNPQDRTVDALLTHVKVRTYSKLKP